MLCKNCGKELPIAGKFCPFCGAAVEQIGVNDETAFFTPVPGEPEAPIDLSAFDDVFRTEQAARAEDETGPIPEPTRIVPPAAQTPAPRPNAANPSVRRASGAPTSPRTTYFEQPNPDDEPYRKPSAAKKGVVIFVVILLIAIVIGVGAWFILSRQPDENLTLAEKYMQRGKFDDALAAYQAALAESKDPTEIQLQIDLLTRYQEAQDYIDSGDYASALALLNNLRSSIADKTSPLAEAVDDLLEKAGQKQSDSKFNEDAERASTYITDKKYDQAAAVLDSLEADDLLTDEQKKQVSKLREQLTTAQESAQRQQQNEQEKTEKKQAFSDQIDQQEKNDQKITEADTTEAALDATATSFEAWDTLLTDMYAYLETILNADQYASEEQSYRDWVKERDEGALNASRESADEVAAQLAEASFKQSYTKTRCYKLLDLM